MEKRLKISAIVLLILTILWVILTALSMRGIDPQWGGGDYVRWAADPDYFFTLNYINATLLTAGVVVLFSWLYIYMKEQHPSLAMAGLILVPVYGALNIPCYALQISLVPEMARQALEHPGQLLLVSELIQARSGSLAGFVNGLAYAILGIPSILYGTLLTRMGKRTPGLLLLLSGIFSLLGFLGYLIGNPVLSMGMMAGGILFLLCLGAMAFTLNRGSV